MCVAIKRFLSISASTRSPHASSDGHAVLKAISFSGPET
jgi:hypothetical protein